MCNAQDAADDDCACKTDGVQLQLGEEVVLHSLHTCCVRLDSDLNPTTVSTFGGSLQSTLMC